MSCTAYRDDLVAWVRGELAPLAHQRLESHLARCKGCRAAAATVGTALRAAQSWDPAPDPAELEALSHRLSPYVEAAAMSRTAPRRLALAGALAAVAVAVGLVVALRARDGARPERVVAARAPDTADAVVQLAPTPFVRVVADASWDGTLAGGPRALAYRMTRGAAAFAFEGGDGRSLAVETPLGVVRAVGTRFSVALSPGGGAMTVGVTEGEVRVEWPGGASSVAAGAQASFDGRSETGREAPSAPARALLDHPFLGSPDHAGRAGGYDFGGTRIGLALELAVPRRRPSGELLARLERAEALALAGEYGRALAIYGGCARDRGLERAYADLCRFEMARIVGFGKGDRPRARAMLERLARGGEGEAARQARLALCELARADEPCRGVECLRAVGADARADESLRREAQRLGERWADDADCPHPGAATP